MKIEFIQKAVPSAWDRATSGRLESSDLVIRNLQKVASDESSGLDKAAESALNIYNGIEKWQFELDGNFADLALDACGLVYVIIHTRSGFLNEGIRDSRDDQVTLDVERIIMDVETYVLRTVLGFGLLSNGDALDYRRKMEECLVRYSRETRSVRTTIQEAVVKVVAAKLMNYEDMETEQGISKGTKKTTTLTETVPIQREDEKRKKGGTLSSSETGTSDDSSESDQTESSHDSDIYVPERAERGKDSNKTVAGNKGKTLAKAESKNKKTVTDRIDRGYDAKGTSFTNRPIEKKSAKSPRRKNNRANTTLADRHRMPEEWCSEVESDEEALHYPTKFQPGPHRRSTTPLPHARFMSQSRKALSSQTDTPLFGQLLANEITSHVMSTIRKTTKMHGDDY